MKKISILSLFVLFIFAALCSFLFPNSSLSFAEAKDVVRGFVTGDNVNIRSAPSTKGKVHMQAWSGACFLVDPLPIRDGSDNSEWYKILFSVIEQNGVIQQAHKLQEYGFSYPYISARFVRTEPISEYEQRQLDYWKQGRPFPAKVGYDLSEYLEPYFARFVLKLPVTLLAEPKNDAPAVELAAGTVILFNDATEYDFYYDMEEIPWLFVIGEDKKLLGWVTGEGWGDIFGLLSKEPERY